MVGLRCSSHGYPFTSVISLGAATSLGELASAYPDAGGQYIWVARLAPRMLYRFFSYITAIISWAGAVCTGTSVCLVGTELILDLVEFFNPHFHVNPWMVFLGYQAIHIFTLIPSFYGKLLGKVTKGIMVFHCASPRRVTGHVICRRQKSSISTMN